MPQNFFYNKFYYILRYSLIAGLLFFSFLQNSQAKELKVLSTTGMIADILKNLIKVDVIHYQMMGSNIDPHTYKPSARDLRKIQESKLIFYNGFHLEASLTKIFQKMKKSYAICEILQEKNLLEGQYSIPDPHIWMDVSLWQECIANVSNILQQNFPKQKKEIQKNTKVYQKKLTELDLWVKKTVKTIPRQKRILVTAHDAFRYFGKAYQFKVLGIQGISTASQAGIKEIRDIADFVAKEKIPAIFVESSVAQHNIIALKEAVQSRGWQVKIGESLFSDAMGIKGSGKDNYVAMIRHNILAIKKGLTQ